ncbi:MAG: N-acetylmuramoyl-L-alanine amidase [Paracoccaceae bacterium]
MFLIVFWGAAQVFAPLGAVADEPRRAWLATIGGVERLTVELGARAPFRIFTLDTPFRIVVDFPSMNWPEGAADISAGARMVETLRFGLRGEGAGARMVVDLARPARVVRAHTEAAGGGAHLILLLSPTSPEEFAALAGWPEKARPRVPPPRDRSDGDGVLVMIDPGHGGADPGASSRGVDEKDVVLDYARALAVSIDARPGFRARLTRRDDEFLTLRERVAITSEAGADVFLSLHADALAQGVATGASVYVLSEGASDREAAILASAHNGGEALDGVPLDGEESDVAKILLDLARRRADLRSRDLAERIVDELAKVAPVLAGRALQSAGFRVLRTPGIPSALIELGFMSSAKDRARLLSAQARSAVVEAVADAVAEWAKAEPGPAFDSLRAAGAGRE